MPLLQMQGKGILIVWFTATGKVGGVERGRLLAPRIERRFLTVKRVLMAEIVVALGDT